MPNTHQVIDFHTHLWSEADGLTPRASDLRELTEMADRFNLDALVVMPLFGGLHPSPDEIRAGNDAVANLARRDPRMKPFVTVHPPHGPFALREAQRCIEEHDFAGLKIWVSIADQPDVFPLIEQMIEYGRPTLIHAMNKAVGQLPRESKPHHIASLARHYPEATLIMAHIGGDFIYGANAIRDTHNVLTDPSGTYCETGMLEYAVRLLGPDRILFGSDAPGVDYLNNLAKVLAADLTSEDQHKILYANARRLLP